MLRRRFRCLWCLGKRHRPCTFSEPDPVGGLGPKGRTRRATVRLREQIAHELPHQTVKRVAEVYGVGQRFVRACFAQRAEHKIAQRRTRGETPRVLGLDEFSMKCRIRYETVFCDLEARQVLDVIAGRDGTSVQRYLDELHDPEQVAVAVMDMSEGYRQVVQLCLPQAVIMVDRFHTVRRVGKALDQLRLGLQRRKGRNARGSSTDCATRCSVRRGTRRKKSAVTWKHCLRNFSRCIAPGSTRRDSGDGMRYLTVPRQKCA